jgi:hypothetical protein
VKTHPDYFGFKVHFFFFQKNHYPWPLPLQGLSSKGEAKMNVSLLQMMVKMLQEWCKMHTKAFLAGEIK